MDKNLNEKYLQLASDLATMIQGLPEAKYILLIGSVVDQTADHLSDIDTIILYDKEPSEPDLATLLGKESVYKFWLDDDHFHVHYKKENVDMTMLFTPLKRIEDFVNQYPHINFNDYAEVSRYIVNGKRLAGDEQTFDAWQKKCRIVPFEVKEKVFQKEMPSLSFWFKSDHLLMLAERSDWIMVNRTINMSIEGILRVIYLLNDEIMIKPKRTRIHLEQCTIKPPDIQIRLENLYLHKNTLADVKDKIEQMLSIIDDLKALIQQHHTTES